MTRTSFAVALGVAAFSASFSEAQGIRQACGERNAIVERLEIKWGETFAGAGMQSASSVFEVWMSAEKGTWTILKTDANGTSCVMASGTNWLQSDPSQQAMGIKG